MAEIYGGLREKDLALAQPEKAAEEHLWWPVSAGVNPRFDRLRDEPRFLEILRKINLD